MSDQKWSAPKNLVLFTGTGLALVIFVLFVNYCTGV
jgi:hypothetical protein